MNKASSLLRGRLALKNKNYLRVPNNKKREERLSLKESRNKRFDKFRRNLRMLRVSMDISGTELAAKINLKNGAHLLNLEYGRANPDLEELLDICKFFKVPMDDLVNKEAKISFS